jgi:hypothetical protein
MPVRKGSTPDPQTSKRRPATTPEGRENQLVALAADLAEKQMRDGTASAQVISHFLKLGSSREKLEQERLAHENHLLQVKADAMASQKDTEELYKLALNAMRAYSGQEPLDRGDDYED